MTRPTLMWLQPGWTLETTTPSSGEDPETGESLPPRREIVRGRGLVQAPLWGGFQETTADGGVRDERLCLFSPAKEISADDQFFSPTGECWQAITDGMPRGVPGRPVEYVATRVRRAKEKDREVPNG